MKGFSFIYRKEIVKKCFYVGIAIIFISCVKKGKTSNDSNTALSSIKKLVCTDSLLMNNLLQEVIDISDLQQYYLVDEVKKRGYLIVKKDSLINKQHSLEKFNKKVVFLNENELTKNNITAFIRFDKVKLSKDKADVIMVYPTQGLRCTAQLKKDENCNWVLISSDIIEI